MDMVVLAGHWTHAELPDVFAYVPTSQTSHTEAPLCAENLPCWHRVQVVWASASLKCPGGHSAHASVYPGRPNGCTPVVPGPHGPRSIRTNVCEAPATTDVIL
jgi:hypothetical protein